MTVEEYAELRNSIINAILGTDMAELAEMTEKVKGIFKELGHLARIPLDAKNRKFMLKAFLHAADLYNAFKPYVEFHGSGPI